MEESEFRTLAVPMKRDTGDETFAIRVDNICEVVNARLDGHSDKERCPVLTISYSSIQMFEKISDQFDKVKIINKARVKDWGTEEHRNVGKQGAR